MTFDINNNNLPWIEEFRPHILNDVILNDNTSLIFKNYVKNKYLPHLLLHGPSGTGKTSTIHACAHEIYGNNYDLMVLEINASKERGIDTVRTKISEFVITKSLFCNDVDFKFVILDEADSITTDAQSVLRRIIEDYTNNARFCLICNKITNIDLAIQSRCTILKFFPLKDYDISNRILLIAQKKNITVSSDGILSIIKLSKGDMRKVINIIQATSMAYDIINESSLMTCIGYPTNDHISQIYNSLINDIFDISFYKISNIISIHNYSLLDILHELHLHILSNFNNNSLSADFVIKLIPSLKLVELNIISCPSFNIQLAAIIGSFYL